jgi:hypothetical protein
LNSIVESYTHPELTRIPVLSEGLHAQLPLELILGLRLQLFKLLRAGIALAIKFFQRVQRTGGELASLISPAS